MTKKKFKTPNQTQIDEAKFRKMETDSYSRLYYQAAVHKCTLWKGRSQQQDTQWTLPFTTDMGRFFFQFYISIIFAMCICTARALSFQMASCLPHSGFHLGELFCICLQNWSQLCSSYQAVTWEREVVHALLVRISAMIPQLSEGLTLEINSLLSPFPNRAAWSKPLAWLWWCSWSRAGWNQCRKTHSLLSVTLRIALLVFNSRHLKINPDKVRVEAIKNIVKHLYIKGLPSPKTERRSWIKTSPPVRGDRQTSGSYLRVSRITDNPAKLAVKPA